MTYETFLPDDLRLCDYELDRIVRNVLVAAIQTERLSAEDVEFLQLWDSGTYFQTAPVPVLFPYDKDISDIARATESFRRFKYYDDIDVVYGGIKYRLLELRGERALVALLNWLVERGISEDELKLGHCGVNGPGKDGAFDLGLGNAPLIDATAKSEAEPEKTLSKVKAAEAMSSVKRLMDGSIPASAVKAVFNMQLKKHGYTTSTFAKGSGLPKAYVVKWSRGQLVIKPDEMRKICKHLGVRNLFEGLPCTTAKSALRHIRKGL